MNCLTEIRDWLTAIGTVGAVIVALWFGVSANRRANREDLLRARLYAAGMVNRLEQACDVVGNCAATCVFGAQPVNQNQLLLPQNHGHLIGKLQKMLRERRFEPSMEALVCMAALPNNCASRIASAFDLVKKIESEVLGYEVLNFAMSPDGIQSTTTLLKTWGSGFGRAMTLLTVAIAECKRAADVAAVEPSGEELNGGPDEG